MDKITINLSSDKSIPLYEQLYNYLKSEIQLGNFKPNSKLPSKRKLAIYLQISQNTIETAYQQLVAEGYIRSKAKVGFFVCDLSEIIKVNKEQKQSDVKKNKNRESFIYQFSASRVDLENFPYKLWKKLSKNILDEDNKKILQLDHSQGDYNLRESISNYLHYSRGVKSTPEQIVVGAGTEYLIQLIIQMLGRDNKYGMESPGYFKIYRICKNFGININGIEMDSEGVDINELEKSLVNILHITPSHQFPLGIIMPINRRINLLNWANKGKNRYIIEDDYDSEFRFSGKPIPALQGLDRNGKVIYLGTFSKSLAPSIRIGYMVLPEELLEIYRKRFSFYACTVSRLEQQTLNSFILEGHFERHLNKMRNIYKKKREKLVSLIKENFPESEIIGQNSGLHLLVRVNNGMTEDKLKKRAISVGVKVLGLSNNSFMKMEKRGVEPIIFFGYANLGEDEMEEAFRLLKSVWR